MKYTLTVDQPKIGDDVSTSSVSTYIHKEGMVNRCVKNVFMNSLALLYSYFVKCTKIYCLIVALTKSFDLQTFLVCVIISSYELLELGSSLQFKVYHILHIGTVFG